MNFANNAFFACDALILLERLPSESAALIYLDPPWGTRFGIREKNPKSAELLSNQYAPYLSKILQQADRILTATGNLFIQWSSKSPFDVRLIANQVFGDQPKYEITWKIQVISAGVTPKTDSELILVYSKSDDFIYNSIFRPLNHDEKASYSLKDGRGHFRADTLISSFDRSSMRFDWRGYKPPAKRSWKFHQERLEALAEDDRIYFPSNGGMPRLKQYLDDHRGREIGTTWDDIPSFFRKDERTGYPGEKPLPLMNRIVELASNPGDIVLDPFCGSGAAIIAAQQAGRRWWGADNSVEAQTVTVERLIAQCGLAASVDYELVTEDDVAASEVRKTAYMDVVTDIVEINRLQSETAALTEHLLSLKKLMNISEDDDQRVEDFIKHMENWVSTSIANQSKSVDSYIPLVCSWLSGWDKLDKASQFFLPQAELLFENIARTSSQDYSPFIIQYCRALENELLTKLFASYADSLYERKPNVEKFLAADIGDKKTGKFAKSLLKRENSYTLGEMNFIMGLMKEGGQSLQASILLQDFRDFTIRYFGERIVERSYLEQIETINKDFRCKAAHPYILDAKVAERCRQQIRSCLNELILNYKGVDQTPL